MLTFVRVCVCGRINRTQFVVIPLAMGLIAVWARVVDKGDVGKRELLGGAMFLRHT